MGGASSIHHEAWQLLLTRKWQQNRPYAHDSKDRIASACAYDVVYTPLFGILFDSNMQIGAARVVRVHHGHTVGGRYTFLSSPWCCMLQATGMLQHNASSLLYVSDPRTRGTSRSASTPETLILCRMLVLMRPSAV